MKKNIVLLLLMLLIGAVAGAENLIYYQDSTATDSLKMIPVSDLNPLPTSGVFTADIPDSNLTTAVSVTSVATNVASLADRKSVNFFSTSETKYAWITLDTSTASATVLTSIPLPPLGFIGVDLDSAKVVGLVASEAMTVIVYQDGN